MRNPRVPIPSAAPEPWRKRRKGADYGLKDLAYLPRRRCGWNMTLAAQAYSLRRTAVERADLNVWATMHGAPASARWAELGGRALVLWHGTSAPRAEKICQVGLFPRKGIWATAEPALAHSFTRGRATAHEARSATIVLLFDRDDMPEAFEPAREPETIRFRSRIGPECIEYVLWDDRIEFAGARPTARPRPWGVARFKKAGGRWVARSRPPVRMSGGRSYATLGEWLELSVRRVLEELGAAAALEIFSPLYATIDPPRALCHDDVLETIRRLCGPPRTAGGHRRFRLRGRG